jgi:hypothetical protein
MQAVYFPEAHMERTAYRVSMGDPQGKRLLGRPRHQNGIILAGTSGELS